MSDQNDLRSWPTAEFGVCGFDVAHASKTNLVTIVQIIWEIKQQL